MSKAIFVHEFGGVEVLKYQDQQLGEPGRDQILMRNDAVGLNFIDVYHRTGLYPNPTPFVLGRESAGEVIAIGEGVTRFKLGDRVCAMGAMGGYASHRMVDEIIAHPIPDNVSTEIAAAALLKGATAYFLLELVFKVGSDHTILFHAAAGGVGQLSVQWAKAAGATVIATVGTDAKAKIARDLGADHVLVLGKDDVVAKVKEITNGQGVDVVYDSIGKDMAMTSLDCLKPRGLFVSFGNSTGPVSLPNLGVLTAKGSLFVTRPTMAHYVTQGQAEADCVAMLFDKIGSGALKVDIGQTFPLAETAAAHQALETRQTTGSTVLIP